MNYQDRPCQGKFCGRPGLPILPLRLAYVPGGERDLPTGLHLAPDVFHRELNSGTYMLRTITEGFVYLWEERSGWRAFAATANGKFKEIMSLADKERPTETPTFACNREGHNLEASLVNVLAPERITGKEKLWVGYSRAWWTADTRKRIAGDLLLRMRAMVQLDAKAVAAGAHPDPASGFKVDEQGKKLVDHVLEYRNFDRAGQLYARTRTLPSAGSADSEPVAALDRTREAAAQAALMYRLNAHGGVALALRDPVGIVQDITAERNFRAGELAQYRMERENLREQVVADLIGGMEGQLRDAGKASEWNSRYAQHVNGKRIDEIRREHKRRLKELETPIVNAANDWARWWSVPAFWSVLDTYDADSRRVALELEQHFADCIDGAGAVQCEQDALDKMFKEPPEGQYKTAWLAFAGGKQSLVKFLNDKLGVKDGVDLTRSAIDLGKDFKEWMGKQRATEQAPPSVAAAVIGRTFASQLTRLVTQQPELASVLGMRITIVAAARMRTVITPYSYTTTAQGLVYELYEAAWASKEMAQVVTVKTDYRSQHSTMNLRGSWVATQIEAETRVQMTVWVPESELGNIRSGAAAAAGVGTGVAVPSVPASPAAVLPTPFQGLLKWMKTLDAGMVGLAGVLTVTNLSSTLREYQKADGKTNPEAKRKALFGVVSGVMGVGAVVGDVTAGVYMSRVTPSIAPSLVGRMVARAAIFRVVGGVFAGASAISEGIYLYSKAGGLERQGDEVAATAYRRASAFFVLSGTTAVASSLVAASAMLTGAGFTAASGGLIGAIITGGSALAFIPVWGWIVLGIAALAAGLYFLFRGQEEEDTPLEVWMSRTCLRNATKYADSDRIPYVSLQEELDEFQDAIYGLRVDFKWDPEVGRDRLTLNVVLPGFGENSRYAYRLTLGNGRTRILIDQSPSPLSSDPDLQPQPAAPTSVSARPQGGWWEQQARKVDDYVNRQPSRTGWQDAWQWARKPRGAPIESARAGQGQGSDVQFVKQTGFAQLTAELLIDENVFQNAELKMEYWPDPVKLPQLMMTPNRNGVNFRMEGR